MERPKTIVILSVGRSTTVCINGKLYGDGIREISYSHEAGEFPELQAVIDRFPLDGNDNKSDLENFIRAVESVCMENSRTVSEE